MGPAMSMSGGVEKAESLPVDCSRQPRWPWLLLAAITGLGLWVRIQQLPMEALWYDESVCFNHLDAPDLISFLTGLRIEDPPMVPFYFSLQYGWCLLMGRTVFVLRLLPVLLGTATIPAVYLLAQRVSNWLGGLVAATTVALGLSLAYYSQEVRPYALLVLLATLSVYTLMVAMETNRKVWWALHLACNVFLIWTHLFAVTVIAAESIYVLVWFRNRRHPVLFWARFHAILVLLLAYWVKGIAPEQLDAAASWIGKPALWMAPYVGMMLTGARLSEFSGYQSNVEWIILYVIGTLCLAAIGGWLHQSYRKRRDAESPRTDYTDTRMLLVLAWVAVPLLFVVVGSFIWRPCFVGRYVLHTAVPICVLAGAGVTYLKKRTVVVAVLVVLFASYTSQLIRLDRPWRTDFRKAAEYLLARRIPRQDVWVQHWYVAKSLGLYMPDGLAKIEYGDQLDAMKAQALAVSTASRSVHILVPFQTYDFQQFLERNSIPYCAEHIAGVSKMVIFTINPEKIDRTNHTGTFVSSR